MDFLSKVLAAMFGRILADDLKAWCPSVTEHLIDLAVRRLPQDLKKRYAEEWRAHIAEIPGEISKLFCAIGFVWAGWRVWEALRIDRLRSLVEKYPGIVQLAVQVTILFATSVTVYVATKNPRSEFFLGWLSALVALSIFRYWVIRKTSASRSKK